jgi:hypothetical protein
VFCLTVFYSRTFFFFFFFFFFVFVFFFFFFFFFLLLLLLLLFSFGVLQLMLPEAPQPYGLLYHRRIGHYNFLHQFRAATPPEQRKLEL